MKSDKAVLYPVWITIFVMLTIQLSMGQVFHSGDTLFIGHGTTPTINGTLSPGEWDDALSFVLREPGGSPGDATVYLKHDTANLYAAFENTNANYWIWWILLDTQNDGGGAPQTDDYKLIGPGYMAERVGNGVEWVEVSPSGWTSMGDEFSSECSISYGKLGITPGVAKTVGIAFCYGGAMPWENVWPPNLDTWNDEVVPNAWGDIVSNDNWGATGIAEVGPGKADGYLRITPNPCSDHVVISFSISLHDHAVLQIYDTSGRLVRSLIDDVRLGAGRHAIPWNGMDQEGGVVPSGTYFVRLRNGDNIVIRQLSIIK